MTGSVRASLRFTSPTIGAVIVLFAGHPCEPTARACDTPVYRYAMYNWAPSPYRVYYFCQGEPDKKDAKVNRLLAEQSSGAQSPAAQPPAARSPSAKSPVAQPPSAKSPVAQPPSAVQSTVEPASANLVLETVDATKKDEVEQLPEAVKRAWEKNAGGKLPIHLVFTSWGDLVSAERLDAAAVRSLVESPVRKQIAQLLEKRHAAVFLLFEGKDPAANAQAEKVAREVIARAAKGQFAVEPAGDSASGLAAAAGSGPTAGAEDAAPTRPQRLQIGLVKLRRANPAEKWLVESLVTVERDMPEVAGLSMVFPVFGRGRACPVHRERDHAGEPRPATGAFGGALLVYRAGPEPGRGPAFPLGLGRRRGGPGRRGTDVGRSAARARGGGARRGGRADKSIRRRGPADRNVCPPGAGADKVSALLAPGSVGEGGLPSENPADSPQDRAGSFASGHAWKYGLGLAAIAAGVLTLGLVLVRKRRDDTP